MKKLLAIIATAALAASTLATTPPVDIAPYKSAAVVTPADGSDIPVTKGLYVGGAGNVNVDFSSGPTVLFSGVPAGTVLPIRVKRVRSTSTTATLIVALY